MLLSFPDFLYLFSMKLPHLIIFLLFLSSSSLAQKTEKPPLHGKHWMAITGKPLAATAGSMIFQQGGNAVDAACAMLAASCTMFDVLSWGGETQALIYNPNTGKVIGINALGVAPTGATPEFFREKDMPYPPAFGPLAAVTPGTPGGLITMLAEYGTMSLAEVLAPAIQLADGYPIEAQTANSMESMKDEIKKWPHSKKLFLVHEGEEREAPEAGEIFRQPDLKAMLLKLVETEKEALSKGKSRKEAMMAAYDRFYKGDIAEEIVRATREAGGLFTKEDLANWQVYIEEPEKTNYKGIDVYKLTSWVQSPVMLQALNMLENFDLQSMGYNSAQYLHTLYQVMNLAYADRDFYYGDPYFPPAEPMKGLLSKEYAKERIKLINKEKNDPKVYPGDPYRFMGETNPYLDLLSAWYQTAGNISSPSFPDATYKEAFTAGTTTIQAADAEGWVVSVTPSGGWVPAFIAGSSGVGLSQRMQSFVLDPKENPFNVLEPGKRPRATLTPSLALKDGKPYLSFAVQGGDIQDQVLLQYFLNIVEFKMTPQEAAEAANIVSYQMRNSFDDHSAKPGHVDMRDDMPPWVLSELRKMGYIINLKKHSSGPINAIYFDREHGSFWGASSNDGEDYGIGW
jgi:gamma-glutamyltranspeptidase / glutathione hydrolase